MYTRSTVSLACARETAPHGPRQSVGMTLQVSDRLEQGSDEWLTARRGIVTASVVGTLITPSQVKPANNVESRALTALLASERITGWTEDGYVGAAMERGWDDEPRAVEAYEDRHAVEVAHVGFMVRDDWGFRIGYSPDGLVGDDGLIEIKSRAPKKHLQTVLTDSVPAENVAQIQAGLLVSGREWCDYVSFCGGMPLWVIRVTPDPRWFEAIIAATAALEEAVQRMATDYTTAVEGLPLTERVDYNHVELKLA